MMGVLGEMKITAVSHISICLLRGESKAGLKVVTNLHPENLIPDGD